MSQLTHGRPRVVTLILAAVLTIAGAGVAFAYWTANGSGTGTASTGTSTGLSITGGTPTGDLAPGSAGQVVPFTVENPTDAAGPQYLTGVTVAISAAWTPPLGCLKADYSVSVTTAPTTGDIAVGGSVTNGRATVLLANTGVNQDACKGASVPLTFTAATQPQPV